ncbi:hypothetical protein RGQ29_013437 [Quercus rubra]|uniref:K Homology domain-containing protein n=1 Tax=Quercus rubra TaxID=3512 RepID=A0AAN7G4Q3_QUERU|nr:hypothetical protein RGQ29_013437 [Quercus rubra]KAK4605371.1 hypothetical protein RGQ29_013437 [Quercus rubra]
MEDKPTSSPTSFVDQSVVPGDVVLDLSNMTNQTLKLGGGLRQAGKLRFSKPNKYWVESSQKRYVPHAGDSVLGIVVDSKADIGTLLYVWVVKVNPSMNPELSCTDASRKAAEFGQLKGGYMFESSTGLSRMLLSSPTCPVLDALGKKLSFETAVGLNGRIWVNASSPSTVIVVANAIMNSESLSGVQQRIMVEKLIQNLKLST